jgi:hypothetical protein
MSKEAVSYQLSAISEDMSGAECNGKAGWKGVGGERRKP